MFLLDTNGPAHEIPNQELEKRLQRLRREWQVQTELDCAHLIRQILQCDLPLHTQR